MKSTNNMIEVVKQLNTNGYVEDFRIKDENLHLVSNNALYKADKIEIDEAYRFESADTPEDTSVVFAIHIPHKNTKGILLDILDRVEALPNNSLTQKLKAVELTLMTHEDTNKSLKFGFIPKVHKSKFNENPHRYVLRKGFNDFPECPFGQSFSMLGYDKELKEYVWLVTSIIKDPRLAVREYKQR